MRISRWRVAWRGEVGGLEAVADLGIAAEGAGAAAGDIAEDEVEEAFGFGEGGGVGVEGFVFGVLVASRRVVRAWRRRGLASVARRWAAGWRWARMRVLPPGAAQVSQMRCGVEGGRRRLARPRGGSRRPAAGGRLGSGPKRSVRLGLVSGRGRGWRERRRGRSSVPIGWLARGGGRGARRRRRWSRRVWAWRLAGG